MYVGMMFRDCGGGKMFLDDIIEKRKQQLDRELGNVSREEMRRRADECTLVVPDFKKALQADGLTVIAEVKKASPSKGLIQPDFHPVETAMAYESAGAGAISCLTEEAYFQGSSKYLKDIVGSVSIPVLRKDFVIDEYQLDEARVLGASAVLLIAAVLSDKQLNAFYERAKAIGLSVLAEAHNEEEVERLKAVGFGIIGINNRNLKTFEVTLETTRRLAAMLPPSTVKVCESGIKNHADMQYAVECGVDAVLIGETLMRSGVDGIAECMRALINI